MKTLKHNTSSYVLIPLIGETVNDRIKAYNIDKYYAKLIRARTEGYTGDV